MPIVFPFASEFVGEIVTGGSVNFARLPSYRPQG